MKTFILELTAQQASRIIPKIFVKMSDNKQEGKNVSEYIWIRAFCG